MDRIQTRVQQQHIILKNKYLPRKEKKKEEGNWVAKNSPNASLECECGDIFNLQ